jgi:hypothetical protein
MTDAPPSRPAPTPAAYQPPPGYVLTPAVPVARSRNLGLLAFVVALFVIVATVVARALGVTAIVLAALGPIVSVGVTLATVATHLPH